MKLDHKADKDYLKKLSKALDSSEGRIKKDDYGYWNIVGTRGHISTETDYWYLYTSPESVRKWNIIKNQLSFMELHQDGDDEGILRCARMPFRDEAREVRKVIGIRPTKKLTEEQRQVLLRTNFTRDKQRVSQSLVSLNEKDRE